MLHVFRGVLSQGHAGEAALLSGELDKANELLAAADDAERATRPGTPSSFRLEELRLARAAVSAAKGDDPHAGGEVEVALRYFTDHGITLPPSTQLLYDRYLKELPIRNPEP